MDLDDMATRALQMADPAERAIAIGRVLDLSDRSIKPGQRYRHGWIPIDPRDGSRLPATRSLTAYNRKGEVLHPNGPEDGGMPFYAHGDDHLYHILDSVTHGYHLDDSSGEWGPRQSIHHVNVAALHGGKGEDVNLVNWRQQRRGAPPKRYARASKTSETGSAKIDKVVNHARSLGLEVTVEKEAEAKHGTRFISLEIRRPRVEEKTALDQVRNGDWIYLIYSVQAQPGKPAAPKLSSAKKNSLFGDGYKISPKTLPYAIEGMAEDLPKKEG